MNDIQVPTCNRIVKWAATNIHLSWYSYLPSPMILAWLKLCHQHVIRILPSFVDLSQMFDRMLKESPDVREYYSPSLVKVQKKFVKNQPPALKSLIRMVKVWAYQCLPESLRKSYPLELLTIHMWERADSPGRFKLERGFRCVIAILPHLHCQLKPVYWGKNHSEKQACMGGMTT